ncbi:MAG: hypothetical protein ACFCUU_07960 [Cyclobacteriaceae bacterium]
MATNLDILTEKIYREGIDKAQKEADELLESTKQEAEKILEEAKRKAEQIVKDAHKEADSLQRNALADVKLAGNQAMSALKQELRKLINKKILEDPLTEAFSDKEFLKKLIIETVKLWKPDSDKALSLPANLEGQLDSAFENSLKKESKNLEIKFDNKLSAGFRIAGKNDDYTLTFTDSDFVEFFKPYLRDKTSSILFNDSPAA